MGEAGAVLRGRGRTVGAAAGLAGAGALAAAWVAQHRRVGRALEAADAAAEGEGLVLPSDLRHHEIAVDDGAVIHVVERGEGPPLLLLHGLMSASGIWVNQLTDLAGRHRVVAVDLRGHGRSSVGEEGTGLVRMAEDVRRVMEELDLRRALVVGHSMGGMVALRVVHDLPAAERRLRVDGLAVVSSAAGPFLSAPGSTTASRVLVPAWSQFVLAADRAGMWSRPARDLRWWATRLSFGAEADPAQVRFTEELSRPVAASTFTRLLPDLVAFDLSDGLADIEVPVLVVVGSRDRLTPPRHARAMAGVLPQAQLVELPRCGHTPMLERRHEFSRLLDEFSAKLA
ncbi:MAG: alpha/beta hydrolase [Acidobacteriota bacterium]|nr:alpha/beta hydrolase [Acidobacteriota bacterium]